MPLRFPKKPLAFAVGLALFVGTSPPTFGAPLEYLDLLTQAKGLPADFQDHFFEAPLAVRILLDRQVLGEALITLSNSERITLVEFTDVEDSGFDSNEREAWKSALQSGITLGPCQSRCLNGLVAAHYSLESSELSLISNQAERNVKVSDYFEPPSQGSTGLMARNQLNIAGGQAQDAYGRYALQGIMSLGNWTQTFSGQVSRNNDPDNSTLYQLYELHTQKHWQQNFLRLGYFTPETVGLSRNIRTFGNQPDTTVGVMIGSSDSLAKDAAQPAIYPIYVTANRNATVEVYRDGALISTQQVQPGLQALNTRPLPGGIYSIQVRLVEDGIVTSTTEELVYKPRNWSNPEQRWRYNAFVGRDTHVFSSYSDQEDGSLSTGVAVNYLLHPRAVVGLSARQISEQNQLGTSLDLGLGARSTVYANVYQTQAHGTGTDIQALHNYGAGSVIFSHSRSWLDNRDTWETLADGSRVRQRNRYNGSTSNSSLGVTHRLGPKNSVNARLSHSDGYLSGTSVDIGWLRSSMLFGNTANWRLSVFDRPGTSSSGNQRNRGIDLSLNWAIGAPGKSLTASVGTRTSRDGENDRNASVGYQQHTDEGFVRQLGASVNADTYGVGLTASSQFHANSAQGDVQLQRSSYNTKLSGALNLESTLVVGGANMALSGDDMNSDATMIVDLESDIDDIALRADDLSGYSAVLRPGRNIVPVSAYRNGVVQFDFEGVNVPAANIHPGRASYHLNKGGVAYQKVRLSKTLTVFGRVIDHIGQPMRGVHVLNHASRGVTEADGFFSMELRADTPTLEVVRGHQVLCRLVLNPQRLPTEDDVLMAGDLRCVEGSGVDQVAKG